LSGPTPSIRTIRPNVPPGLDAVLRRSLEKEPAKRYPNIAEFATALADFAPRRARASIDRVGRVVQSASMTTSGVLIASAPGGQQVQTGGSWADTKQALSGKSRKGLWIAIAAVAAVLGVAAFVIARRPSGTDTTVLAQPAAAPAAPPSVAPPPVEPAPTPAPTPVAAAVTSAPSATPRESPPPVAVVPPSKGPAPRRQPSPAAHTAAAPPPAATPPKPPGDLFDDRK
jgi:serine/threonine-protein kinase